MTTVPSLPSNELAPGELPRLICPPINVSRWRSEKQVKQKVKQILDFFGWFHWMPATGGYGVSGVHDFNALKDGAFLSIETKFGPGKATALQSSYAAQVIANTSFAFLVNEKNIDHLVWYLQSFAEARECQMRGQEVPPEHGSRMLNSISVLTDGFDRTTLASARS